MTEQEALIKLGRKDKKIARLLKQRDYWKKQYEYYKKVISLQPYLETRWENYEKRKAEQEKNKQLENRVKEQEVLIRMLLGNDPLKNYEIDVLYSKLIKEEYKKINEALNENNHRRLP